MSVVNKRERRKNAGQRMGSLLGKAMEEDDTFWSHETWNDDDGEDSGNDSFRESDEDSVLKKDVFDSDFDDSESDNEDDDVAAGEAEELELQKSERARRNQKSSTNYVDAKSSTARGNRGKRGAANKRAVGVGFNAGIVLKFPSNSSNSLALLPTPSSNSALQLTKPSATTSLQSAITTAAAAAADTKNATVVNNLPEPLPLPAPVTSSQANAVSSSSRKSKNRIIGDPVVRSSRVSLRERRSTHGVRKLRENRSTPSRQSATTTTTAAAASTGRSKSSSSGGSNSRTATTTAKRKRHSQEELLLEAIHETEPENQRWLFGRKRTQDQHDKDKDLNSGFRDKYRGRKVIQKFHSRRGCLNTLTFPEMDAVPEILTRRQPQHHHAQGKNLESRSSTLASSSSAEPSKQQVSNICVITGKPGKYKDPITDLPYHDLTAFKELRRRHKNGIPILVYSKGSTGGEGTKNNKQVTKKKSGTSQGDGDSFSGTATKGDKKPATHHLSKGEKKISTNDGKNNKINAGKKAPPNKSFSPSDAKLPFQSPKPPSRPSISTVHKQQSQQTHPKLPTFSLSRKDSSTTKTKTAATTTIDSSISPSGRRLSPRKWKPSEKVLENICMSPEKDGVLAAPRLSSIKPQQLVVATGLNIQRLDDKNDHINKTTTGSSTATATATNPSSSLSTSVMSVKSDTAATKIPPPPPVKSSLPTAAATPIAGTSANAAINSANNSNGISQKTTTSATIATAAPSTGGSTKNGSSHDVCTAKIEGNNIRKNSDAVTENTDKNTITSTGTGTKGQEIKSKYEEEEKEKTEKQII